MCTSTSAFIYYPNGDVVLTTAENEWEERRQQGAYGTGADVRANSHDSELTITDEVEANVGRLRTARWPKERLSAALLYSELLQKQICCFPVRTGRN